MTGHDHSAWFALAVLLVILLPTIVSGFVIIRRIPVESDES